MFMRQGVARSVGVVIAAICAILRGYVASYRHLTGGARRDL
jgi:hypothetical protein